MKKVALVGMAKTTRDGVLTSTADEIWTLNHTYAFIDFSRIDRLFDLHPWDKWILGMLGKRAYQGDVMHYANLAKIDTCPVYMLRKVASIPNGVAYPINQVTDYIFGKRLQRGGRPTDFFRSTFDYMMALAIYERFDVIESYGFEMQSKTEYRYQRESAVGYIMYAIAKGITYRYPEQSRQIPQGRYGYDGGLDMVSRQVIEKQLLEKQAQLATETETEPRQRLEGAIETLRYILEQLDLPE